MRTRNSNKNGFTLLELVVVLAILAVVTTLALRSLDHVLDGKREETNRLAIEELRDAVLGSPDDRAADGTRMVSGFVADMGRLPLAVEIHGDLTLAELWMDPGNRFDIRPAIPEHGVPAGFADPQVLVSGGWRGPYLHLPMGSSQWRDGWGNPMVTRLNNSGLDPFGEGYARLRNIADEPLDSAGQEIRLVRHLGANGILDESETGYNQDGFVTFGDSSVLSSVSSQVEVMDETDEDQPEDVDPGYLVTLCVFHPDPADASKIKVRTASTPFSMNPVVLPVIGNVPHGPRVVRGYFHPVVDAANSFRRSAVRNLTLRPGSNFVELKIDR